jgi:hypothetical protein
MQKDLNPTSQQHDVLLITITEDSNVASNKYFNQRLDIRITAADKQKFLAKCEELNRAPQSLLREMVQAVNDGRLKIQVTPEQLNNQQEIYNVT